MNVLDALIAALGEHRPITVEDDARSEAAVALLVTPDPDRLLLIRRAEREGDPWSGHLALPGGRRHASDGDLLDTAIRETAEETGIVLRREWCRAQLDDLAPRAPNLPAIIVRPFVFLVNRAIAPGVSSEVAHAAWLRMADLMAEGVYRESDVEVRGGLRTVAGYHLPEGFLWGMTERILTPILERWRSLA
jgi:8-oxo-dGTP pyrophosphatase MutT (NUDIX family)